MAVYEVYISVYVFRVLIELMDLLIHECDATHVNVDRLSDFCSIWKLCMPSLNNSYVCTYMQCVPTYIRIYAYSHMCTLFVLSCFPAYVV